MYIYIIYSIYHISNFKFEFTEGGGGVKKKNLKIEI